MKRSGADAFEFEHSIAFDVEAAEAAIAAVPARCGVLALCGKDAAAEPYLARTVNLQSRARRMLMPAAGATRRLNLSRSVARIEYTETGSEFESLLTLYQATVAFFGAERTRKRMRLYAPFCIRFVRENAYPRAYVTNRISMKAMAETFGPYPSRAAAERALTEMLNLFKLRRCAEELEPEEKHPGCIYSEMKMCLAPCFKGCTDERYAEEAAGVLEFLRTRGESMTAKLEAERDAASGLMEFEQAAAIHAQMQKAKAAAACSAEMVRALDELNAVVVQPAAGGNKDAVSIYGVRRGCISTRPLRFATHDIRHANAEAGSTSLFVQPQMPVAIPLNESGEVQDEVKAESSETRLRRELETLMVGGSGNAAGLNDHLSLLRRWYYRPARQRVGEIFFVKSAAGDLDRAEVPVRRILRGVSRVVMGAAGRIAGELNEENSVD